MKNYVYAKSYIGIHLLLYLKSCDKKVILITPRDDMIRFCNKVKINYVRVKEFKRQDYILKNHKVKYEINRIANIIKNHNLHFSHIQVDTFCFLLVKQLSTKCPITFYPIEQVYESDKIQFKNIKDFIIKYIVITNFLLIRVLYNIRIEIIYKSNSIINGIRENFFKKNNIKIYKFDKNFEYIKDDLIRMHQVKLFKCKNLFITQNLHVMDNIIEHGSIKKLYEFLSQEDIVVKLHPNFNEKNMLIEKDEFPLYIPAEFLYSNVENSVISIYSLVLISACKFPGIKSISLLHLVDWVDKKWKDEIESYWREKSDNMILFPSSYKELHDILNK